MLEFNFTELNFPLSISTKAASQELSEIRTQNSGIEINLKLNDGIKGINFDTALSMNQKLNKYNTPVNNFDSDNYFTGWKDITFFEFSSGEANAGTRAVKLNGKLEGFIPYADFKPCISYESGGVYKNTLESSLTDLTKLSLCLPVTFSNNSLSFTLSRTGGNINNVASGGSYITDANTVFNLQQNRTWLYSSIPFYELFQKSLKENISADYSTKYEFAYKRKLSNSFKDLYIPSSASFGITRSVLNTNSYSDVYQFKAVLTNTSLNNFGSDSIKQLFTWFKQEEIISSITGIIKLPADLPENITYNITAYIQTAFMIAENTRLTAAADFSLETNLDWAAHYTMIYSRPGTTSFITSLINYFNSSENKTNFIITRKESSNIELSSTDRILKQKYNYLHSMDFSFNKYFTVTTGIGAGFTNVQNSVSSMLIDYSIGGKAEF